MKKIVALVTALGIGLSQSAVLSQSSEDCIGYNLASLKIVNQNASGWLLTDTKSNIQLLDTKADAEQFLLVAKAHTQRCSIGRNNKRSNRADYIFSYFKGGTGQIPTIAKEDSIAFDSSKLAVKNLGATGFTVTDGNSSLALFDTQNDAARAIAVLKNYNRQVFVGRGNTRVNRLAYIAQYLRKVAVPVVAIPVAPVTAAPVAVAIPVPASGTGNIGKTYTLFANAKPLQINVLSLEHTIGHVATLERDYLPAKGKKLLLMTATLTNPSDTDRDLESLEFRVETSDNLVLNEFSPWYDPKDGRNLSDRVLAKGKSITAIKVLEIDASVVLQDLGIYDNDRSLVQFDISQVIKPLLEPFIAKNDPNTALDVVQAPFNVFMPGKIDLRLDSIQNTSNSLVIAATLKNSSRQKQEIAEASLVENLVMDASDNDLTFDLTRFSSANSSTSFSATLDSNKEIAVKMVFTRVGDSSIAAHKVRLGWEGSRAYEFAVPAFKPAPPPAPAPSVSPATSPAVAAPAPENHRVRLTINDLFLADSQDTIGIFTEQDEFYLVGRITVTSPDGSVETRGFAMKPIDLDEGKRIDPNMVMFDEVLPKGALVFGEFVAWESDSIPVPSFLPDFIRFIAAVGRALGSYANGDDKLGDLQSINFEVGKLGRRDQQNNLKGSDFAYQMKTTAIEERTNSPLTMGRYKVVAVAPTPVPASASSDERLLLEIRSDTINAKNLKADFLGDDVYIMGIINIASPDGTFEDKFVQTGNLKIGKTGNISANLVIFREIVPKNAKISFNIRAMTNQTGFDFTLGRFGSSLDSNNLSDQTLGWDMKPEDTFTSTVEYQIPIRVVLSSSPQALSFGRDGSSAALDTNQKIGSIIASLNRQTLPDFMGSRATRQNSSLPLWVDLNWSNDGCSGGGNAIGAGNEVSIWEACVRHDFNWRNQKKFNNFTLERQDHADYMFLTDMDNFCRAQSRLNLGDCYYRAYERYAVVFKVGRGQH